MREIEKILDHVLTWLSNPYIQQDRIKGDGVDCGSVICEIYDKIELIDHLAPRPYLPDWNMHEMGERYLEHIRSVCFEMEGPTELVDIVLYKFGKCVSHGIIVVEWPTIIHSYIYLGVILQDDTKGRLAG